MKHKQITQVLSLTSICLIGTWTFAQSSQTRNSKQPATKTVTKSIPLPKLKIVAPVPKAAPTPSIPYDFKSIKLGITLSEFRATPYPDSNEEAGIIAACSGDVVHDAFGESSEPRAVRVYGDEKELGAVRCVFWGHAESARPTDNISGIKRLALGGGEANSRNYWFSFYPDAFGVPRLYEIVLPTYAWAQSDIVAALTQKFGESKVSRGVMQTRAGAEFEKSTHEWENGSSTIRVETRVLTVSDLYVTYTLTALAAKKSADEESKRASRPNRM